MSLNPLSFGLSQITNLIANLNKKNFDYISQELTQVVVTHGLEADRQLLRCLLEEAARLQQESGRSGPVSGVHATLLAQQPNLLLNHPARISVLCHAVDRPTPSIQKVLKSGNSLFSQLARYFKLSSAQEVALCLALRNSCNPDIVSAAQQHLRKKFLEVVQCYLDTDSGRQVEFGGLQDCSPEVLQVLLGSLAHESFGLAAVTKELFIDRLKSDFPRELVPVVLAPLLYPDDTETPLDEMSSVEEMAGTMMESSSLTDLVREIGFSFTSSVEECKNDIMNLIGREPTAPEVARVISMMIQYHIGPQEAQQNLQTPGGFWIGRDTKKESILPHTQPDAWNAEVFVQALNESAPNLSWKEVVKHLDHPEFIVKDRQGLVLLFAILRLGLQSNGYPINLFPMEYIYRHWHNIEGQLSLIAKILKYPDVFDFADYPYQPVAIEILKTPPESDNKDIATWRSLYLIELLIYMWERGYPQAHELLKYPLQKCPDVLMLAILQINAPVTMVVQDLLTNLIPIFLANHPNSAVILHQAWHSQNPNVKSIIMHAMADWYLRGENDQTRLSRILDVAQDLKALSLLLNVQSFLFVIDLACLASRREYLKLDKWLSDKVRDHGESFVSTMVKFLQRRCPQVIPGKVPEEQLPKAAQLPHETIATMVSCLHICVNSVQPELSEAIVAVCTNCSFIMNKQRQTVPGITRPQRVIETPFNPAGLGGQIFNPPPVDPIVNLAPNFANLNLGAPSNTPFSLPGSLGPLVSTPGSPSRMIGPVTSNSPFPMMPIHAGNIPNMGAVPRIPVPIMVKERLPENQVVFPDMTLTVSKDVEDEANGYFQRIYNHPPHPTISIDEVLDMLKKFQDSPNKKEKDVFNCMLRNLFEEYRFFPQYPDKELYITAQLFGGIIERGLVMSYVTLGLALRFVLDGLRKPEGNKMYYFGITALDRFKSKLKEFHKYCEHVRAIPHFSDFPPHLIEYVEYGLQGQEPPTKPQGPVLPPNLAGILTPTVMAPAAIPPYRAMIQAVVSTTILTKASNSMTTALGARPSIATATNIDTLLVATDREEKITAPPESVQEKTAFIFNNLSQLNLQIKCDEVRDIINEEYWPWLSQYLVMKRASIELNFHILYSNFLDGLKIMEMFKLVTNETYRNIKVLLRSDKGIGNFSDRSLLKNLGHWLGMLTLGRNKPILQVDLDLKMLLLEAYRKGQQELLYVVPFVAKVLESCSKCRAFRPPSPWTMAIMNVLAELHQEPELKLNLKFEIEVLCKNLNIDVTELKPAFYLKDLDRLQTLEYQMSHPNKPEAIPIPIAQPMPIQHQPVMLPPPIGMIPEELVASAGTPTPSMLPMDQGMMLPMINLTEPRYNYIDVNVSSAFGFGHNLQINPHIVLFQTHPQLKHLVKPTIERSIQEWIHPVVDRSVKYALPTCEQIVRKDFALDPEEGRMRTAAHHIMRNLTAGMAMITCREQLLNTMSTNLKATLINALIPAILQQDIVESASTIVANENMELACAFIQKTAVEKALPEIDKRLYADYELRKLAKQEGRRYYDPVAFAYQAERMPERLRLKVGGVNDTQLVVYEEFARKIPGFMPFKERETGMFIPKPVINQEMQLAYNQVFNINQMMYGTDELTRIITDAEQFVRNSFGIGSLTIQVTHMHSLLEYLIVVRRNRDIMSACTLLQKAVEGLLEGLTLAGGTTSEHVDAIARYRDIHIRALKLLQDNRVYGHLWTTKQVTRCATECREEIKYNFEAVDCLIRAQLINIPQYDSALVQMMDGGNNFMAVAFAMQLIQFYLVDERANMIVNEADFFNTIEMLIRITSHPRQPPPEGLSSLIEILRLNQDPSNIFSDISVIGPAVHIHAGILQAKVRDYDDPPQMAEKTDFLIREWINLVYNPPQQSDISKNFSLFLVQMNNHGILKNDDMISRFFRIATEMVTENVYCIANEEKLAPASAPSMKSKCFHMPDAVAKLIALLVKNSDYNNIAKLNLLNKFLGIVTGCLLQDHEQHGTAFEPIGYQRIFITLFLELNLPEAALESINLQITTAFCHTLHILRPSLVPGFSYTWMDLVGHRNFIGRVLAHTPQQKGWGMYSLLLIDLFKFIAPFLRNTELAKPIVKLYRGTLRLLLVMLHDFPEILCDYHHGFCDEIPPNCIQMRNLILSAFPRSMRLPDPFTPNLKVDLLPEIVHAPRVLINYAAMIQPLTFKKDLDSYLKARAPVTFLSELRGIMQISNESGRKYNTQLMNAVVLYVGTQAIAYIRGKGQTPNMTTIAHSAHMDILQNLVVDLDHEGRYLFVNAIVNQLRFPNSHTHYFSCALLYLFSEANAEVIQEQITRTLLERLIVSRPHPWGLLITFIELIKNPIYKFWDHEFVRCAPEIEKYCTNKLNHSFKKP